MAQSQIDSIQGADIEIKEIISNRIICRLGITQEIIVKKVKGEMRICLKEDKTSMCITGDFFKTLLSSSESLQFIYSFVES